MKILVVLVCLIGISVAEIVDRPFFMQPCKRNDKNRNECVKDSIEKFLEGLRKNPNYYSDLQFEPLIYGPITFSYDYENFLKGYMHFKKCYCYGLQNSKVLKTKTYFTDKEMTIYALLKHPKLWVDGEYEANGELLPLRYANAGTFNVTMLDVTSKWTIKGSVVNRDGEEFLNIDYFDMNSDAKQMKFAATGSRPNDLFLKSLVDFINQSWRPFYEVLLPETRKQWNPVFKNLANRVIRNIPYRQISLP